MTRNISEIARVIDAVLAKAPFFPAKLLLPLLAAVLFIIINCICNDKLGSPVCKKKR